MIISFSGLDGAGKSTLITGLKSHLEKKGRTVRILTMYDDISFYSFLRSLRMSQPENQSNSEFHTGIIPQDPKVDVSDKKGFAKKLAYRIIRSQWMRRLILPLDLLVLLLFRLKEEGIKNKVLITDRYLYDTMADVVSVNGNGGWTFVKSLLHFTPTPSVPVFVDVPAEQAYARKPEYPLPYAQWRRTAYQKIFGWVKNPLILDNTQEVSITLAQLTRTVEERLN